jgi:hypothetical protein
MEFNDGFFKEILESEKVGDLCETAADAVHGIAYANAPVESGDYRDGLKVKRQRSGDRVTALVVGEDWKTLLVESQTGNLARAVRAVKRR